MVKNLFKISQNYKIDLRELLDDSGTINFSGNEINRDNNIFANNPLNNTISILPFIDLVERFLQSQERISLFLDSQIKLITELLKNCMYCTKEARKL